MSNPYLEQMLKLLPCLVPLAPIKHKIARLCDGLQAKNIGNGAENGDEAGMGNVNRARLA